MIDFNLIWNKKKENNFWNLYTYQVIKSVSSFTWFNFIKKLYEHLYSLFAKKRVPCLAIIQFYYQKKARKQKDF